MIKTWVRNESSGRAVRLAALCARRSPRRSARRGGLLLLRRRRGEEHAEREQDDLRAADREEQRVTSDALEGWVGRDRRRRRGDHVRGDA